MSKCQPGETVREHYAHGGTLSDPLPGEDLITPEHLLHASPLERFRLALPEAAGKAAQIVADNPGQFALLMAGTVVLTRVAARIVRPRTPLESVALMIVLQVGLPQLAMTAMARGWLKFRLRDDDGNLISFIPGEVEPDAPPATPQA
jgi:hypothetical protein